MTTSDHLDNELYLGRSRKPGLKRGTTTIGLVYEEGVILATDTRVVQGMTFIAHKKGKKIHKIDDHMAMTIAGTVADAQVLVDVLRYRARMFRLERGFMIPVRSLASLASLYLFQSRLFPMSVQAIIGGVDLHGAELYQIDPLGGMTREEFISTGSGSPVALGFLEASLKKPIKLDEAVPFVIKSILVAMSRDTATGDDFDIAVIDSSGYREYSAEEKNRILAGLKEKW